MDTPTIDQKVNELEVTLRIGKNGLTSGVIEEMKAQLKKHKMIKIKMLRSSKENHDKQAMAQALEKETGAKVIKQIGHVVVLRKT